MADPGALRNRRYRQHRQGNHQLCRHDRPAPVVALVPAAAGEFDPALEMRRLAGRLAAVYEADPGNTAIARELRMTLLALEGVAPPGWDAVDELAAEEARARAAGPLREDGGHG